MITQLYTEWPEAPDAAVGLFRSNYASRVGDPYFEELIAALTAASADFRAAWQRETTISLRPGRAILTPPRLGRMTVDSVRLTMPGLPGHILFVLLPADPATERRSPAFAKAPARTPASRRSVTADGRASKRSWHR